MLYSQNQIGYDQIRVDSLKQLYKNSIEGKKNRKILLKIIQDETDPNEKLHYANLLIELIDKQSKISIIKKDSINFYLSAGYLQKGNAHQLIGDYDEALQAFFMCMECSQKGKDNDLSAAVLISIADTYSMIGNSESAEKYYDEGILLLRDLNDPTSLGSALLNAGDEYFNTKHFIKALNYFEESKSIFEQLNYPVGIAYNKGNIGMVYAEQGKDSLALLNINEAVAILEELEDYYPISVYLTYMADIYADKNDFYTAIEYAHRSLDLAKQYDLRDQKSESNLKLSELYEMLGNYSEALMHHKTHIKYRDSIRNIESVQNLANIEVKQKQSEVDLLEQKRKNQRFLVYTTLLALLSIIIFTTGLYKRHKFIKATNVIIEEEKQRSDNLLLNILPEETAQELKEKGRVEAKRFESVTVLFTDFKGFSRYAKHLTPEELVQSIDFYFSKFDNIIEKYELEKIKTVGDAYMCAGGLPFPTQDHARKMILAAMEIAEFVNTEKQKHPNSNTHFDIRIGINTGPVVAGVVGSKKYAYDIWGDAVNIASRMESGSEAGKINISEFTYELVKDQFHCEYRGEIEVKNRGKLKMYFVNGVKQT